MITFISYGYRVDAMDNDKPSTNNRNFLGVIFTETGSIFYRPHTTEVEKGLIEAKREELRRKRLSK